MPLALAACDNSDVRSTLGLEREAPDEFVIYSRPPLSLPPEFELRPPRDGGDAFKESNTRGEARGVVLGTNGNIAAGAGELVQPGVDTAVTPVLSSDAKSAAESNFLKRSGSYAADPEIRVKLKEGDSVQSAEDSKSLFEKIINSENNEPLVDATKEAERLRENKQAGKPVNEGDVPTIDPNAGSVLDKIF